MSTERVQFPPEQRKSAPESVTKASPPVILLAALAGFGFAVLTHGVTFGLGVRYCIARSNPSAYERILREAWQSAIKLGRAVDSLTVELADVRQKARAPRVEVKLVEVPHWRPPR